MATSELTFDVRLDLAAFSAAIDQARTTLANFVQSIPPITIPVALAMPANAQSAVAGLVPPVAQAQAQLIERLQAQIAAQAAQTGVVDRNRLAKDNGAMRQ